LGRRIGTEWLGRRRTRIAAAGVVLLAVAGPAYADPDPTNTLPPASVTEVPSQRSLEQMQAEAAKLQAEFARATIAYTNALRVARTADATAAAAERRAAALTAQAAAAQRALGRVSAQAYQLGIPATITASWLSWAPLAADQPGVSQLTAHQQAAQADAAAAAARAAAAGRRAAATTADVRARQLAANVRQKATESAAAMQAQLAELPGAQQVSAALQKTRNDHARTRWQTYLAELAAAGVRAPTAAALRNPARLPAGMTAVKDATGKAVGGVAQVRAGSRTLRVLPAETVRAVNKAFGLLGTPYGVAETGPDRYGCLGAARVAWQPYTTLPNLVGKVYPKIRQVPNDAIQPGDLLLIGNDTVGLYHIGVAIGGGEMIASDEGKGSVIVSAIPQNLYAAVRPVLGSPAKAQVAPQATDQAFAFRCGATPDSYGAESRGWSWPLPDGTFEIGTPYGQPGALWASGVHTGQDFPAAIGTPVLAVGGGTAYVEHPGWAGTLVRVEHGNGLATIYAHLSSVAVADGQPVQAGQQIGGVGSEGNSTGPHLHFEVRLGGQSTNPMPFLATGSTSQGWGGFSNGMIPASELCGIPAAGHMLRCDAATAYQALMQAYQREFGRTLCITDSYRSYASQVTLYAKKPSLAALPGTSNHGWGVAVDLCGGIQRFGTTQHKWMLAHAPTYGWVLPRWARPTGSRPEPWHWEYRGA
jgi:murein DD-endopeptidase MepM/ murein hydrolase activator NlpD